MADLMATEIPFRRDFNGAYGKTERITPLIRRVLARNPGPFTFKGTGTYIVGHGKVAVIDPGPDLSEHIAALVAAVDGETVTHILVTHTHLDHSPAAAALKRTTGAKTFAYGPHGSRRTPERFGGVTEEGGDHDFLPDVELRDGDILAGPGWHLTAVETPGHTSNHLCFAMPEERSLFSGDHVMGWSTSVIAPPDGDMAAYMRSLEKLLHRNDSVYWPTHGPPITAPRPHVEAFIAHRRERSEEIMKALAAGDTTVQAIVARVYVGLDPRLNAAAGRSVLAHLIELVEQERAFCDGPPSPDSHYRIAR